MVNVNLTEKSVEKISKFVAETTFLDQLDLSWCKTTRSTWTQFFEEIKNVKTLRHLNLTGNLLIEKDAKKSEQCVNDIIFFMKKNL